LKSIIKKISQENRDEALEEIGEYLLQEILTSVGGGKTPVQGGRYKKTLSKAYKSEKKKISSSTIANMELHGDMLDALDFKIDVNKMNVEIGFLEGAEQQQIDKADNHNKFSAKAKKTKLPARQFIPRSNERFKKKIMKEVQSIAEGYASQDSEEIEES
jgi:hypothetical protein